MGSEDDVDPGQAHDAAGFVERMRWLKERSGLTYRQLEERAAEQGEVLARSTLAYTLRTGSLPRAETLAAFLRACGEDRRLRAWLEARDRIAAGSPSGGAPDGTDGEQEAAAVGGSGGGGPELPKNGQDARPWEGGVRKGTRWMRVAAAVGVAAALTAIAGVAVTASPPQWTPPVAELPPEPKDTRKSCRNGTCRGKDPKEYQCLENAETTAGVKTEYGMVTLWYSAVCQALWADLLPTEDEQVLSVYLKSDTGDALSLKSNALLGNAIGSRHTPMLPSEFRPEHGEVCVGYRALEACADSDGVSRVKPYPTPSPKVP
ncbi:DUF2690 domain-containing protein [Streptomyces sp. NPDC045431]|uniref:DUF2690 domain-containing protein n=1 Tax=Streptomyces sp. NPDC045431 TaxID=3155613 RepID=UPI003401F107